MKSSSRQPEQALELWGFPLRPVVLSLLLHALLLGLAPQFAATENSVPPASVLQGVLLPAPSSPDEPALALQRFVPPAPVAAAAVASRAVPGNPISAVTPPPTFVTPPLPEKVQATSASGGGGEVAPRHMPGPATVALAQETDERGVNAAGLRQFRLSLAGEARRFRRYPEAAERAGLTGTAEVRVSVEAGGLTRRADLSRSSGHALLDAAALEMLRQAAGRVVLPESLHGQSFAVLLPVVFEVEE